MSRNTVIRRADRSRTHRSWYHPLLERLEDRLAPALADGTIFIATAPSPFASTDQSSFPTGIIDLDPSTKMQCAFSTGGLFSLPTYVIEVPNELLYVSDLTPSGEG